MDALRLEDKIQMLEARINMALELVTLALERIDNLVNKIKFAVQEELKSDDEMDLIRELSPIYTNWDHIPIVDHPVPVEQLLDITEKTIKMKINRDFISNEKDGPFQEHRDPIRGRRASGECKARSRSESPRHYSTRRRENSDEQYSPSSTERNEALLLGEQ